MQSQRALRFYLERAAPAGRRAVARWPHRARLRRARARWRSARPTARRSARTSPIGAPSSASTRGWPRPRGRSTGSKRRIRAVGPAPAYEAAGELQGRSRHAPRLARGQRLGRPGARPPAVVAARGRRLRLPSRRRSTCARTPTCTSASWPSWSRRPASAPTMRRWTRTARVALLAGELGNPRPLASPHQSYGEETAGELAMLRVAADAHRRYGAAAVPHYVISKADSVSDILEVAVLLKEVGLLRPREGRLDVDIVPLFETIDDLQRCGAIMDDAVRPAGLSPAARLARRHPGGDARLFRQQQGRRLPHLDLGALQGRAGADRRLPAPPASGCACSTAAAARSAAAAGRATRRSWRSRPAPCRAQIRITEQGEVIAGKYSNAGGRPAQPRDPGRGDARGDAARGATGRRRPATISRSWRNCRRMPSAPIATWSTRPTASTATSANRRCSRRSPASTSAAVRRRARGRQRIEDLRAIPWVFSWAQCRLMLPGWYGFGAAVKAWIGRASGRRHGDAAGDVRRLAVLPHHAVEHGHGAGQERHRHRLALRRAGRRRQSLREAIFGRLRERMAGLDRRGARRSRGSRRCWRAIRLLARSIRNRFPYIDPLNHVQIELLRRHRAGDADPGVVQGIHLSINGIAAGLRNSG